MSETNLIEINLCVTRARKLLTDEDYKAIPELIAYYDRYKKDAASLERMFNETGLGRYETLAQFKHKVAAEIVKCIEGLNEIRSVHDKAQNFENDSFQEAVRKLA